MSDSNYVSMNIPAANPLFDWVMDNYSKYAGIQQASVIVGDVTAKLALSGVEVVYPKDEDCYLETSWRLLRDNT